MDNDQLIGLDWGTSSLRAYLLDANGTIVEQLDARAGVQRIERGQFLGAFETLCAPWLRARGDLPAVACGMIGSRHGWRETSFLPVPAGLDDLCGALTWLDDLAGRRFAIIPGVCTDPDAAFSDVMRGEETQVFGALEAEGLREAHLLLPGTYSKWVRAERSRIRSFRTFMTGELFDVLSSHSILGRLFRRPEPEFDLPAFKLGLDRIGEDPQALTSLLFTTRAEALLDRMQPPALPSYLSALLIGAELSAISDELRDGLPLLVVANPDLTWRYGLALDHYGWRWQAARGLPAARGMAAIAHRTGLLRV